VKRGAEQVGSDGGGRLPDRSGKPKRVVRVNWECLVQAPVHGVFKSNLRKNFSCILGAVGDIESEWAMFKASIVAAAARSSEGSRQAEEGWLARRSPETADGYREARRAASSADAEAKT